MLHLKLYHKGSHVWDSLRRFKAEFGNGKCDFGIPLENSFYLSQLLNNDVKITSKMTVVNGKHYIIWF
jgi:hypothetical protein